MNQGGSGWAKAFHKRTHSTAILKECDGGNILLYTGSQDESTISDQGGAAAVELDWGTNYLASAHGTSVPHSLKVLRRLRSHVKPTRGQHNQCIPNLQAPGVQDPETQRRWLRWPPGQNTGVCVIPGAEDRTIRAQSSRLSLPDHPDGRACWTTGPPRRVHKPL